MVEPVMSGGVQRCLVDGEGATGESAHVAGHGRTARAGHHVFLEE
jgi:hypothetical protein